MTTEDVGLLDAVLIKIGADGMIHIHTSLDSEDLVMLLEDALDICVENLDLDYGFTKH